MEIINLSLICINGQPSGANFCLEFLIISNIILIEPVCDENNVRQSHVILLLDKYLLVLRLPNDDAKSVSRELISTSINIMEA